MEPSSLQPGQQPYGALLDRAILVQESAVKRCEFLLGQLNALEAELIDAYAQAGDAARRLGQLVGGDAAETQAYRSVAEELGAQARVAGRTMEARLSDAHTQREYRAVLAALERGEIHMGHVRVIADEGAIITDEQQRRAYERAVLELARSESSNRLRPLARRLAQEHTDVSVAEREATAREERCVFVRDLPDGMARLEIDAPATQLLAVRDRIRQMARQQQRANRAQAREAAADKADGWVADERTLTALQADIAVDLLLGADPVAHPGVEPGVRGSVRVVVPAVKGQFVLLG